MGRRLSDHPEIAAHDVVTRAMRRVGGDEFCGTAWIPALEQLTRSLDREARLSTGPRRRARSLLVDLLASRVGVERPLHVLGDRPVVAVVGTDAVAVTALETALRGPSTAAPAADRLDTAFCSLRNEERWHVPSFAEWLAGNGLADVLADVVAEAAAATAGSPVVGAVELAERLPTLESVAGRLVVVDVVGADDEVAAATAERSAALRAAFDPTSDAARVGRYWTWRIGEIARRRREHGHGPTATAERAQVLADPGAAAAGVRRALAAHGVTLGGPPA